MAAGTCLSLFAQCVEDDIVAPVVPFVEANINNPDWKFREGAVMAFGNLLSCSRVSFRRSLLNAHVLHRIHPGRTDASSP
jgi:hypothetical protein